MCIGIQPASTTDGTPISHDQNVSSIRIWFHQGAICRRQFIILHGQPRMPRTHIRVAGGRDASESHGSCHVKCHHDVDDLVDDALAACHHRHRNHTNHDGHDVGFLDDGFLDDGFLDDGFLHDSFLDDGFLHDGFLDDGFLDDGEAEADVRAFHCSCLEVVKLYSNEACWH